MLKDVMWKLVKRHVPEKKIVKVEGAILVEDEDDGDQQVLEFSKVCLLYTSPSPRD